MNLPLFPLPLFILPDGVTKLRIFEQRYLTMVKNCHKSQGFVVVHSAQFNKQKSHTIQSFWGSWVDIINFEQDSDGLLLIDVQCQQLVNFDDVTINKNGLMESRCVRKNFWQCENSKSPHASHSQHLRQFFAENPHIANLYPVKYFDSPTWLCARWLELLPIEFEIKQSFVDDVDCLNAQYFIDSLFVEKNTVVKKLN